MEAKAFQVCIPRCKGQFDVATNEYKLCLALCKKEQYKKME